MGRNKESFNDGRVKKTNRSHCAGCGDRVHPATGFEDLAGGEGIHESEGRVKSVEHPEGRYCTDCASGVAEDIENYSTAYNAERMRDTERDWYQ